ncbi:polyprenyl diphosphate synthase [Actinoplanes sp. G11-F43]|uniref:polyprenyl diphosphate synthase n=1 Tax=Actinoplanes sp. G11-F43 TaxID=3424130 RepID=UPI003D32D132
MEIRSRGIPSGRPGGSLPSMMRMVYAFYTRRLRRRLDGITMPRHVAMVLDGDPRRARPADFGAGRLDEMLSWCAEMGIHHITVFVASADHMRRHGTGEADHVLRTLEEAVAGSLTSRWRVHVAGRLDVLPDTTRHALKLAVDATRDSATGFHLNIAIGYDGREEIVDAVREILDAGARSGHSLTDIAETLTAERLAAHLYTGDQPDPDLVIRTSGVPRTSGFLLWQAAHSELYFCDAHWPGFRKLDFLRALRAYAARHRRFGT